VTEILVPSHAVIIPFYGHLEEVAKCLFELRAQSLPNTKIVLVDDGAPTSAMDSPQMKPFIMDERIEFLRHTENRGVAAARNTAIRWCRQHQIEILIMIDSDCLPGVNFISDHLKLHREFPQAACIGGGIIGVGNNFWAKLNNIMS